MPSGRRRHGAREISRRHDIGIADRARKIYRYNVDAWNTCEMFKIGHRIRVEIASSGVPKYDRNPNTGDPLGRTTTMQPADQKIFHDREHPSHVILPIDAGEAVSA